MSNEDKLAAPSFENMDGGFSYKSTQSQEGVSEGRDMDYSIDADIVTNVEPDKKDIKVQFYIGEVLYEKTIRQDYLDQLSNKMSKIFKHVDPAQLAQKEEVGEEHQSPVIDKENLKRILKPSYKLYNKTKTTGCFEEVNDNATFTQVLSKKTQKLNTAVEPNLSNGNKVRSTDLVIMVE